MGGAKRQEYNQRYKPNIRFHSLNLTVGCTLSGALGLVSCSEEEEVEEEEEEEGFLLSHQRVKNMKS